MPMTKATINLDRARVERAQELTGAPSMSALVALAVERLILQEETDRDVAAYAAMPQTEEEIAFGHIVASNDLGDDDVDYDTLYGSS